MSDKLTNAIVAVVGCLLVITLATFVILETKSSDPMPTFPDRIGPDGGPAPLSEDEFRRLQDWMRRNRQ